MINSDRILRELDRLGCYRPPQRDTHCVPFGCAKSAALLFDRIYVDHADYMLALLRVGWEPGEDMPQVPNDVGQDLFPLFDVPPPEMVFLDGDMSSEMTLRQGYDPGFRPRMEGYVENYVDLVRELYQSGKLQATPVIREFRESEKTEELDDCTAWELVIEGVSVPRMHEVKWEQIKEFREDQRSIRDLRGIRNLHARVLGATSITHAQDEFGRAVDQYEVACKKHGLTVLRSSISILYGKKSLFAAALVGGLAESLPAAALAAGISIGAQAWFAAREHAVRKHEWALTEVGDAALIVNANRKLSRST